MNPAHLRLGGQSANMRQMHERGRARGGQAKRALTDDQIDDLWERAEKGQSLRELGAEFGVSHTTISNILNGLTYRATP